MNEFSSDLLSADYLVALRLHIEQGSQAALEATQCLARTAVKHGFETLELAKIHHQALAVLLLAEHSPIGQKELTRKADVFFAEAIMPIERTHNAADLEQLNSSLNQRTTDLAASDRKRQVEIDKRKSAEAALRTSEHSSSRLLKDSELLERHLQDMTRKILFATENERRVMSLRLNDEIAQALLGIHIRMIALKNEIAANQVDHNQEIAVIQQLVEDSADMIKRLTYEFSVKHT